MTRVAPRSRSARLRPVPSGLTEVIELQRIGCEMGGSALYASVLERVAADVASAGACAEVLAPYASAPPGDAVVLRLLAAVHELVLAGRTPDLAAHYPSAGGTPGDDVGDVFVATVAAHLDEVRVGIERPNQTNEVGRSAVLLGGLLEVASWGLPLRLLEVGASGGLNLNLDRYRYVDRGWAWGPDDAGVRFEQPWDGPLRPPLDAPLSVAARRGCDLRPLDVGSSDDRRRLRALLWPDQPDRRARLDAAIDIARAAPRRRRPGRRRDVAGGAAGRPGGGHDHRGAALRHGPVPRPRRSRGVGRRGRTRRGSGHAVGARWPGCAWSRPPARWPSSG